MRQMISEIIFLFVNLKSSANLPTLSPRFHLRHKLTLAPSTHLPAPVKQALTYRTRARTQLASKPGSQPWTSVVACQAQLPDESSVLPFISDPYSLHNLRFGSWSHACFKTTVTTHSPNLPPWLDSCLLSDHILFISCFNYLDFGRPFPDLLTWVHSPKTDLLEFLTLPTI